MALHRLVSVLLVSAAILCAPSLLSAQDSDDAKAQVFSGYSGYRAGGTVNGVKLPDFIAGWASQFIFKGNRRAGFVVDVNGHYNASASAHDFTVGPRFQFPLGHVIPFLEAETGIQHLSPKGFPSQNSATYIGSVGIDVKVNSRFSIRPFQLSIVNTYYPVLSPSRTQGNNFNGFRVQSGLVYDLRWHSPAGVVIASCSAEPSTVDAGTAVKIGVIAKGFPRKQTLFYSYAATGGAIAGSTRAELSRSKECS